MALRTEEDARKTWCPFARVAAMVQTAPGQGVVVTVNRSQGALQRGIMQPGCECLASDCAFWVSTPLDGPTKSGECAMARDPNKAKLFNS